MGKSVNKVILLGRVGKDPVEHILRSGTIVTLSLATSERYRDGRGEWQERTEWHNLVGYQRTAEILRDYVHKGSHIYIEGKVRNRSWDDRETGQKRYRSEVVVLDVSLLSPPPEGKSRHSNCGYSDRETDASAYSAEAEISRDEVPY